MTEAENDRNNTLINIGLYSLVVFSWGFSWYAIKLQLGVVAVELSLVYRFGLSALLMFCWLAVSKRPLTLPLAMHGRILAIGLTLFCTNFYLFYNAGSHMASGLLSVIFSTASLINVLLVSVIFKEKPSLKVIIGVFIGLFGLVLLFGPKIFAANTGNNIQLGVLLAFLGTCSFCTGNMLSSASQRRGVPVLTATAWAMAYGTCYLTLFALISGTKWTIDLSPTYLGSLLFLAVFASVIAFASYLTLLGRIGPAKAAYATVTFPAVALTVSAVLEDYQFTLYGLVGIGLILLGNILVLRKAGKGKGVVQKTV